jgi:hypothetical protein
VNDITGGLEAVSAVKCIAVIVEQLMVSYINRSAKNNDTLIILQSYGRGDLRCHFLKTNLRDQRSVGMSGSFVPLS